MNIDLSNEKDILVMKLLHYFVVKKNYSPIIIRGIEDEIWLENPNEEFRIIRILTKSVYNDEQYEFDIFKIKSIIGQIKRKTLNPFMKVLSIYTITGDNFKENVIDDKKYKFIIYKDEKTLYDNEIIKKYYPDLKDNMDFKEEGYALLGKITAEISKKNLEENVRVNSMFKEKKPIVTYTLIIVNIIVFILMYTLGNGSEDNETLVKFGANVTQLIKGGDYYRLITSAFLHIGLVHLFCNMYSLYILGPNIESFYGKGKFIGIYFYSAIMGSLFTMVLQPDNVISAGASGAIFGLLGALLYFGYNYRGYIGNTIIGQVIPIIAINLAIGFMTPGISNAAHIGGLIGGFASSFMLGVGLNEGKSKQINGLIITIILTAFMVYMAFFR